MSRSLTGAFASTFRRIFGRVIPGSNPKTRSRVRKARRRLLFESLENRAVMATNLGEITGRIFIDTTGDGFTAGEQVVGANIELYTDNGDGIFNAGTDTLSSTDTTDANGVYDFPNLTAGNYFVRQPSQTVGVDILGNLVSILRNISATEAQGITGTTIDRFLTSGPTVSAAFPVGTTGAASLSGLPTTETLGGERDLFAELTAGGATDSVSFSGGSGQVNFSSEFTARGRYVATWDGVDNSSVVAANGLGGIDLTSGGTINSIRLNVGADQANGQVRFRIYSGAGNVSQSALHTISVGNPSELIIPFAEFTQLTGTGGSFANAGAIEMEVIGNTDGMDGRVTLIDLIGPSVETQNFDNHVDLALTKDVNNASPLVGENVTFTITVSNAANVGTATGLQITDQLPAGLNYVSHNTANGTYNNATGIWTIGTLVSGASATLTILATVSATGTLTNTGTITAVEQNDISTNNNTDNAAVASAFVDLAVAKTVDDATPDRNQNVSFTVSVTNQGTANATGVTISDTLPAGLTFVSANTASGTYTSGTGVWNIGNLNSGATASLTIVATVATSGVKTNTATVATVTQTDSNQNNNTASASVTPNIVDVSVAKTVNNATPNANQNVTFTITLANAGPATATNMTLTDTLPTGITFVSSTPSVGSYNSTTGVWTVPTLASGANATLQLVGTVTTTGVKTNTATLTGVNEFDLTTTNDAASAAVTPNVSDISLTKVVDNATPNRNQNVTFTITASNLGPNNASNVSVTDTLPAGVTFVSSNPSAGTYNSTTGVWTIPTLNNGANATLQLVGTVTTTGAKTNTATVSAADQFDSNSANNSASATVTPNIADLSVTKTVDNSTPNVNQNVTFTITVANAGPAAATNVAVNDLLPTGMTFVSSNPSQGSYVSGTGVWTVGTINSGANATLQIVATPTTNGTKTNTAQVSAVDQFDPDSTPNNSAAGEDDQANAVVTPPRLSKRLYLAR